MKNGFTRKHNLYPFFLFQTAQIDFKETIDRIAGNFNREISAERVKSNTKAFGGRTRYAEKLYPKHIK